VIHLSVVSLSAGSRELLSERRQSTSKPRQSHPGQNTTSIIFIIVLFTRRGESFLAFPHPTKPGKFCRVLLDFGAKVRLQWVGTHAIGARE
jgi:hypothetical protein